MILSCIVYIRMVWACVVARQVAVTRAKLGSFLDKVSNVPAEGRSQHVEAARIASGGDGTAVELCSSVQGAASSLSQAVTAANLAELRVVMLPR